MPEGFKGIQNTLEIRQGIKGSGKTNSIKVDTAKLDTCYFIDIRDEYDHVPKVYSIDEFVKISMAVRHGQVEESRVRKIAFNFKNLEDYITLFQLMNSFKKTTIVIDESDALYNYPKFERALMNLTLGCRNNQIDLMYSCKRPFLLPIFIRSQADKVTVFQTFEARDIRWLEDKTPHGLPFSPKKLKQGDCFIITTTGNTQNVNQFHYEEFKGIKQ